MATVDHLRVDHHVTVLREFADARGVSMSVGDSGVIRSISFDHLRSEILIGIERDADGSDRVTLTFPLRSDIGPRNGNMREFFELGSHVDAPVELQHSSQDGEQGLQVFIAADEPEQAENELASVNSAEIQLTPAEPVDKLAWWRSMRNTAGPDHHEDAEKKLRAEIQHIGVAGSIAEMYAQRMRAFLDEGNEERAIAAFKLANDWMATYASWATSGGEGAALSYERDQFRKGLVKELGFDPAGADK